MSSNLPDLEEEASEHNIIICLKWVKRGVAKRNPYKVQLTKEELIEVINDTKEKLRISEEAGTSSAREGDEYNFEAYDEEDESTANALGISSLAEFPTQAEDNFSDQSEDSDDENMVIKPDDNLLLVGRIAGEGSYLEIHVYNEDEPSFYSHHDIYLSYHPLCFEWLSYKHGAPDGNYCAVGQMLSPDIEVWDLDVVNCIEPAFKLGKGKANKPKRIGHKDSVCALAWNKYDKSVMASGSVDKTIMLWDLENKKPSTTIRAFTDIVQCLQWHPFDAPILLAGACDSKAKIFDYRCPSNFNRTWKLPGEAEKIAWNPLQSYNFFVGTNDGTVCYYDIRQGQVWSVDAHPGEEITGLSVSDCCPGLLVTSSGGSDSTEGTVKIWDYDQDKAVFVAEHEFRHLGNIRCMELSPDSPFVIAAGGDKKSDNMQPYHLFNVDPGGCVVTGNKDVKQKFESRQLVEATLSHPEGMSVDDN